jgi:hypothetical protein
MTTLTRRDQLEAQQIIRQLAPNLAMNGVLKPNAAQQMCDGFVTPQNLRQAEQAMQRARMAGDPDAFNAAQLLHQAINVQMAFQDPRSTLMENRSDKIDDAFNGGNGGVYGNGGIYDREPMSGSERTGYIVGTAIGAAITLMAEGRRERRRERHVDHHHHDHRFRR